MNSRQLTNRTKVAGVESPCIRNCCLDDQDICLGCFRSLDNITQWRSATEAQKQEILHSCEIRRMEHREKYSGQYADPNTVFGREK